MSALAHGVVAGGASAIGAGAVSAQVVAVAAGTGVALVVVAIVLTVCVATVQVVHVIQVNHSLVPAVGAVGVSMCLGVTVRCYGGHDCSLVWACTSVTM